MKPLSVLALTALASSLLMTSGCGDDDAGCPTLRPGHWRAKYTLRAGSDADCRAVPDRTLEIEEAADLTGDSTLTCPLGCSCSQGRDSQECTVTQSSICEDSGQSCTFELTSRSMIRASCEVYSGDTDCTVDIIATWESDAL